MSLHPSNQSITHHLLAPLRPVGGLSASGSGLTVNSDGKGPPANCSKSGCLAGARPSPRPTCCLNLPACLHSAVSLVSPGSWLAANRTGRKGAAAVDGLYGAATFKESCAAAQGMEQGASPTVCSVVVSSMRISDPLGGVTLFNYFF